MTIPNTPINEIKGIINAQREYFASNITLDYGFRKEQLKRLQAALVKWEKPLLDALWSDLHSRPRRQSSRSSASSAVR